ncbi:hypothetical protein [Palleronia sp. LCG004]|uniref:hypothetical protein n=1 Tax=Palleronia sp. LCG004 TaxID=3079304 RepID=UPI002942A797|nr:hypothetical protein [Palleronia sp. LCG004]WOI56015.1 hypothetical protein RVY76_13385 [Palleronia sp. LCG004]
MFANYILRAQLTAKMFARRAVYGTLGTILILIGVIFFGAAIWISLADSYGAMNANLIVGGAFFVLGLIVLVIARIPPRIVPRHQAAAMADPTIGTVPPRGPSTVMTTASIAQAFVIGLTAARAFGRRN